MVFILNVTWNIGAGLYGLRLDVVFYCAVRWLNAIRWSFDVCSTSSSQFNGHLYSIMDECKYTAESKH